MKKIKIKLKIKIKKKLGKRVRNSKSVSRVCFVRHSHTYVYGPKGAPERTEMHLHGLRDVCMYLCMCVRIGNFFIDCHINNNLNMFIYNYGN